MIIYGWGDKTIKTFNDSLIKCKNCGAYAQQFTVFQKYFHIFWIPFIPTGRKRIYCQCTKCNDSSNENKSDHYLSQTRTPIYMFSWLLIFAGIFLYTWGGGMINNYTTDKHLKNPKVGDVYIMTSTEYANKETIHFAKIVEIEQDTIFIIQNAFYYESKTTDEMVDEDYFITNDIYYILKKNIPELKADNTIRKVIRSYNPSSNFNKEYAQEIEDEEVKV